MLGPCQLHENNSSTEENDDLLLLEAILIQQKTLEERLFKQISTLNSKKKSI